MSNEYTSSYAWLLAPGDSVMADHYGSPTIVRTWMQAVPLPTLTTDKEKAYGQWIAQLLQGQLGIELAPLYHKSDQAQWPFALRADVIEALDDYFARYAEESESCESE